MLLIEILSFEENKSKHIAVVLNKTDLADDSTINAVETFIRIDEILSDRAVSFYRIGKAMESKAEMLNDVKIYGSSLGHQLASDVRNWINCIL
jgi:ribosome biogenesis GTPase A